MSWIKTSFLWMMHRSGWGTKENQERILQINILLESLTVSCLEVFYRCFAMRSILLLRNGNLK